MKGQETSDIGNRNSMNDFIHHQNKLFLRPSMEACADDSRGFDGGCYDWGASEQSKQNMLCLNADLSQASNAAA